MLEGLLILVCLSAVMAIASLLAGAVPLSFALTNSQLRLISTIGMGVLVGTSLIVIIPEGIETLYTAGSPAHSHSHRRRDLYTKPMDVRWSLVPMPRSTLSRRVDNPPKASTGRLDALHALPGPVIPEELPDERPSSPSASLRQSSADQQPTPTEAKLPGEQHDSSRSPSPNAYVGLSLILGFIFMFLIDKIPQHASTGSHAYQPHQISLETLTQDFHRSSSETAAGNPDGIINSSSFSLKSRSISTTLGLVIHAATDGIALGASSSAEDTSLGLIVFLAIMIHKAPAAFGLTSVLLKQGLTKREARAHLVIFSFAAPVGALATWSLVHLAGGSRIGGGEGTQWWTGILLLFSAGTFLYVFWKFSSGDAAATALETRIQSRLC